MPILRIQHSVQSFDGWKRAFDSDPVDRKAGGVRRYRVLRSIEDPTFVMIDLEFDDAEQATRFLVRLRELWGGRARDVMRNPQAWIVESVESKEL